MTETKPALPADLPGDRSEPRGVAPGDRPAEQPPSWHSLLPEDFDAVDQD